MPQSKRDHRFQAAFGRRLATLVEHHLKTTWRELGLQIGYASGSVLLRCKDGMTGLSAQKLSLLACVCDPRTGSRVSVDWLLTGKGDPLLPTDKGAQSFNALARSVQAAEASVQRQIAGYMEVVGARQQRPGKSKAAR